MAGNQQDFDATLDQLHSVVQDFVADVKNFMERAEQGLDFSQEITKLKGSISAIEDADAALTSVQEEGSDTQPTDGAEGTETGEDTATDATGTDTEETTPTEPTEPTPTEPTEGGEVVTEPGAPDATDTQPTP